MKQNSYNNVIVSRSAIVSNYLYLKSKLKDGKKTLAMIKANAYGHGAREVALALQGAGCSVFGVAETREAVHLRENGLKGEIFVMMGFTHDAVSLFFEYDLTPVVFSLEAIECLSEAAAACGKDIGCHIKVETGMGRLGFEPDQAIDIARKIDSLPGVFVAGLLSHFPESEDPQAASTQNAYALFSELCTEFKTEFSSICHLANSGAMLNFPEAHFDMGRVGISLYGYHPEGDNVGVEHGLIPAMSFATQVLQVKEYPAGVGISYGHTFTTSRRTKLAVLPVGYEDGYMRSLSNCGEVLVRGQRAPICGRICMNICMVDVTDIDGVEAGDEVVLLGRQEDETITADDIATWANTISYEVLCMIGHTNKTIYID